VVSLVKVMSICSIIVTDSARGRIFNADTHKREIVEIEDLVHTESRSHGQTLTSDRDGRRFDGGGGRHAMSDHVPVHKQEAEAFARVIAKRLLDGYEAGDFRRLRLAAPPEFLGLLRKHLDTRVLESLEQTINKNLVHETPDAIVAAFSKVVG
jgi:protein required for attachment to host cells